MVRRSFRTLSLSRRSSTHTSSAPSQSEPALLPTGSSNSGTGIQVTASNGFSRRPQSILFDQNPLQVQGRRSAQTQVQTLDAAPSDVAVPLSAAGSSEAAREPTAATTAMTASTTAMTASTTTAVMSTESITSAAPPILPVNALGTAGSLSGSGAAEGLVLPTTSSVPSLTTATVKSGISQGQVQATPSPNSLSVSAQPLLAAETEIGTPQGPVSSMISPASDQTSEEDAAALRGGHEDVVSAKMPPAEEPFKVETLAVLPAPTLASSPSEATNSLAPANTPCVGGGITASPMSSQVHLAIPSSDALIASSSSPSHLTPSPVPSRTPSPISRPSSPSLPPASITPPSPALSPPLPPAGNLRPALARSPSSGTIRFSQTFSPSPLSRTSILVSGETIVKEKESSGSKTSGHRSMSADEIHAMATSRRASALVAPARGVPRTRSHMSGSSSSPPSIFQGQLPSSSSSSPPSSLRRLSLLNPLKEDEVLELPPPPSRPASPASSLASTRSSSSTVAAVPSTSRDPSENWLTATSSPRFSRAALPSVVMPMPATAKNRHSLAVASANRSSKSLSLDLRRTSSRASSMVSVASSCQSEPAPIPVTLVSLSDEHPDTESSKISSSSHNSGDSKVKNEVVTGKTKGKSKSLEGHGEVAVLRAKSVPAVPGKEGKRKRKSSKIRSFWKQLRMLSS
ncbi:hypothetical protein FRB96_008131 [Tulasnella sp. 330]|nr:hypothetical protein FRB96_008131 [Tulasnella sp. 330]